jgi:DNA modification methylase
MAELAEWDEELLMAELEGLAAEGITMDDVGFDLDALEALGASVEPEGNSEADAEPQIDKAEEFRAKWGVEPGQLWELGDHRLLCGDSTKKEDVERMMGEDKPLLMVTDPPYGVEYDADWRNKATRADGTPIGAFAVGKVENDSRADWREAWQLFNGDVAYVWHAGLFAPTVAESLAACGFELRSQIVWAKSNFAIGRGDYQWKHEPCWYSVRKGKRGHTKGDRSQTTLWEIDKPQKSETGHSTQKPVECMARPIRNHDSEFVYEPFSGSGTTIIACEQLGRKCRAIEISPGYVAVAIQRWGDATGKEPKLIK